MNTESPKGHTTSLREKVKEVINAVNEGYADEEFISEGYGYFDSMVDAMESFARSVRREALRECAAICDANDVSDAVFGESGPARACAEDIRALAEKEEV